tara:strand:- start:492 stop:959 length:468 start_codon:yes stop_codon:yes gene_type:complete
MRRGGFVCPKKKRKEKNKSVTRRRQKKIDQNSYSSTRREMTTSTTQTPPPTQQEESGGGGVSPSRWAIGEPNTPYELNVDDTAKDPVAFRDALMRDEEKRPEIEKEKDLAMQLLGEDVGKFQECLKDLVGKVRTTPFVVAECARCARFERETKRL